MYEFCDALIIPFSLSPPIVGLKLGYNVPSGLLTIAPVERVKAGVKG